MREDTEIDYWSKEVTHCLKGYLCLCILIHHLYLFSGFFSQTYFGHFLNRFGLWAVAVFFFISGYGLGCSYLKKGITYMKSFFSDRILTLYFTYLVFVFIYMFAFRKNLTWRIVLTSFTWGGTIVSYGWFFQIILSLYVIFYLSFRFVKWKQGILIYIFLSVSFCYICIVSGQKYLSIVPFSFGIFIAFVKQRWDSIMSKWCIFILIGSFLAVFGVYLLYVQAWIMGRFAINPHLWNFCSVAAEIAAIMFVMCVCYLSQKKNLPLIVNPVSRWLSGYSMEIYACQGLVLSKLYQQLGQTYVFVIAGISGVIILAVLIHHMIALVKSVVVKVCHRSKGIQK